MSKELEALERLYFNLNSLEYCDNHTDEHIIDGGKTDYDIIKQALTPPTAEEVCKVLSEYIQEPIIYVRTSFVNERETAEVCGLFGLDNYDLVDFNTPLPPHLITLIGRFYQGLEESK